MERFFNNSHEPVEVVNESIPHSPEEESNVQEFEPKFKQTQEDLLYLFNLNVTSKNSLNYPWVKDEMYEKVTEELKLGTPNALDYMFKEGLLTMEDLFTRRIYELKPYAITILQTYKGVRLTNAKELFINSGLLTEEETKGRL